MSGDVQPRKRKDKKRKKDELGVVEEPRGTAAALGEGDVFMHSYHDHGTGGHWCAKIIFFSLLAILLTLIGLIILENRGLSELEANAVESRYSGVLNGWLEDAPDDDHHDEHTLELNHPVHSFKEVDNKENLPEDEDHDEEAESDDGDEHEEIDGENDNNDGDDDEIDDEPEESEEKNEDDDEDRIEELSFYSRYFGGESTKQEVVEDQEPEDSEENNDMSEELDSAQNDDEEEENNDDDSDEEGNNYDEEENNDDDDDDAEKNNHDAEDSNEDAIETKDGYKTEANYEYAANENDDDIADEFENYNDLEEPTDKGNSQENEDEDEHNEDDDDDDHEEVEHIEKEVSEEEPLSLDLPVLPEADEDDGKDDSIEGDDDGSPEEDNGGNEDEEFLEQDDDDDEPIVERITAPAGKPFVEIDEDDTDSTERSPDTLEEEEEYEKKLEEKRREEEEQGSNMWLKLSIGGALLAATHAVVRRATSPRDAQEDEDLEEREETPSTEDRRMTLIPEDIPPVPKKVVQESSLPVQEQVKKIPFIIKSAPTPKQASLEDEEPREDDIKQSEKELYSDDDELEEEEEVVKPEKKVSIQSAAPKQSSPEPDSDEEVPDDVEIIDEEQIEEELAEEDEEEEISDVDDAELLTRLEAKYGRLPEPERFGPKPKGGGNSVADQWPGEPSDSYWRQQLDTAEDELNQGAWSRALERASAAQLSSSGRARWISAKALDLIAEARRDNALLTRAINAYIHLLKMNEGLSDKRLIEVASKALERIKFRGNYLSAEPVYRLLIRRFPNEPVYRNNLTITFLMASRSDLAERVVKETLELWPQDRIALAHYGFILKTEHNRLEEAIDAFQKALDGDIGPANEPRFYYHLGDSLLLLGRFKEAHEVHKRGAALGHFLSPAQRSLYNVERLKSRPWWDVSTSPYSKLARALEKSWKEILKEGEAARALYEEEKEGLKERGEWTQLDLFVRGREIPGRCKQAPVTCSIIKAESASCSRGQIKFSAMEPGTHVRPHVGPTNCRLRMHLGLSNTKDTFIRVDQETRQWQLGKVLMFDDSFEHEVWHNGTGTRLVLIVDVWHPDLTPTERRQLPPI